jgi:hypothetical protein
LMFFPGLDQWYGCWRFSRWLFDRLGIRITEVYLSICMIQFLLVQFYPLLNIFYIFSQHRSGLPVDFVGALDDAEEGCIAFNLVTLLINYSDKSSRYICCVIKL